MDYAYLAGFFDGEGCVGVYGNRGFYLLVQLTQNDGPAERLLLEQVRAEWGGRISEQRTLTGRTKLGWSVTGDAAAMFLDALRPYLRLKAAQASYALAWQRSRPVPQRGGDGRMLAKGADRRAFDEAVVRLLRALKREDIDVVMAAQSDLVVVERELRQVFNYKGTN